MKIGWEKIQRKKCGRRQKNIVNRLWEKYNMEKTSNFRVIILAVLVILSVIIFTFYSRKKNIKYLPDYSCDEKMARKDAEIMALRAQMNPHFLNNTLEMMNWQARMSGNQEISGMIEALRVVLDYNMNRELESLTSLAEELRCADAYFHIISKRFERRLTVRKEIDEVLLQTEIPPLTVQPMIENALVHVEQMRTGKIKIKIYHIEDYVYIQVISNGKLAMGEALTAIKNADERIKLNCGAEYGVKIEQNGEYIVSTAVIPYRRYEDQRKQDSLFL